MCPHGTAVALGAYVAELQHRPEVWHPPTRSQWLNGQRLEDRSGPEMIGRGPGGFEQLAAEA
jgi:hypothetical protein